MLKPSHLNTSEGLSLPTNQLKRLSFTSEWAPKERGGRARRARRGGSGAGSAVTHRTNKRFLLTSPARLHWGSLSPAAERGTPPGAPLEACRGGSPSRPPPPRSVPAPGRLRGSFSMGEGAADTWRPSRREPSRREPARPGPTRRQPPLLPGGPHLLVGRRGSCPAASWRRRCARWRRTPRTLPPPGCCTRCSCCWSRSSAAAGAAGGAGAGRRRAPSRPPHGAPPLPLLAQPAGSGAQEEEEEEPRLWRPRSRPRSAPFLPRWFPGSTAPTRPGSRWGAGAGAAPSRTRSQPGPGLAECLTPSQRLRTPALTTSSEAAAGSLAEVRSSQTFP